jgi:glycosyltransferase involved in cell wall biosynthesis
MIEALSIGLPVIATRAGGIPDALSDDINALLVSRDAESLANAIVRLCEQPMEHARLGSEGRRLFLKSFDLRHILQRYHNLYLQSLQELHHPPIRNMLGSNQSHAALSD